MELCIKAGLNAAYAPDLYIWYPKNSVNFSNNTYINNASEFKGLDKDNKFYIYFSFFGWHA